MSHKQLIAPLLKYELAEIVKANIFPTIANTYVSIGRPIRWGADNTELPSEVEDVVYTTDNKNQLYRDMIAIKKVVAADTALVVPRVDWAANFKYDEYTDHLPLYIHERQFSVGAVNVSSGSTLVNATAAGIFTGNLSVGNTITIGEETKEIINLSAATGNLNVNSVFTSSYTAQTLIRVDNTYPKFANTFYVRNSKDQVFKCLYNANVNSTVEPTIDIDGQLPENPYIEPGDGYKWKYLYTIPYGLKQKFFTKQWMPVINDNQVTAGSVDGRIDIIRILDGGDGYYLDGQSGNSNSLSIVTVTGDGTGASVTAKVQSGVITDLNILKGGSAYTNATITITDTDKLTGSNNAIFDVVIGPAGGHGSNPAKELGSYTIMTTVEFDGTEGDKIPVGTGSNFDFRQISLIRDPKTANGLYANSSVYRTTYKVTVTDPGITNFTNDETVSATGFTATVVSWDANNNKLDLNNVNGTLAVGTQLSGAISGAKSTVLIVEQPEISLFTGDVLYIENREKVVRDTDQSEQIRVILSF